jgi:hypothetical protein
MAWKVPIPSSLPHSASFPPVFRQAFDAAGTLAGQILEFAVVPDSFRNTTNIRSGWEQVLSGQSDVAGEERCSEDGKSTFKA